LVCHLKIGSGYKKLNEICYCNLLFSNISSVIYQVESMLKGSFSSYGVFTAKKYKVSNGRKSKKELAIPVVF
jgi:hypothetical protein